MAEQPKLATSVLVLEYTVLALVIVALGIALAYQLKGWKLDGADMLLVVILTVNYSVLLRAHLARANARIDALEKKLAG